MPKLDDMNALTIRKAVPPDAELLAPLIARALRITNIADYPAEVIEGLVAKFTATTLAERMAMREAFVAVEDFSIEGRSAPSEGAAIVGTASFGMSPVHGSIVPKLHMVFVEPERQRQGIGARLVAHIEALARAKAVAILHVSATLTACPFYARLGYELLETEERADGTTTRLMRKGLG